MSTSLRGIRRYVADKILFPREIMTAEEKSSWKFIRVVALVVLPLYFITVSFYIFLFGVSLGPKATKYWLIGSLGALMMDIFVLQPAKIWMEKIAVLKK